MVVGPELLEASGIYSLDLALALHRAPRIEVMVVNPRAARDFAKAFLLRSKTDAIDAWVPLEFVRLALLSNAGQTWPLQQA